MWDTLPTNKVVGALWPNDGDGNAWGDPQRGFPAALTKAGYKLVDPGRYPNLSDDFSAQISAFKKEQVEIVTGVPIPPDWTTFWKQAAQQGFKPKVASRRQGAAVPALGRGPGQPGRGHVHRGVVDAAASVQVLADRGERRRPGRRLHEGHQEAVDAAARLHPRAVRGRGGRAQARRVASTTRARWSPRSRPPTSTPWWARSTGARGRCRTSPRPRSSAGSGCAGKDFRFDMVVVSNKAASNIPVSGKLRPIGQA